MRATTLSSPIVLCLIVLVAPAAAHPGSGIVVTTTGRVFFLETGNPDIKRLGMLWEKVEVVLKSERPWSPTGVAVHGGYIYVLEYTNANGGPANGWAPRVRKLARDGKVSTFATVPPRANP